MRRPQQIVLVINANDSIVHNGGGQDVRWQILGECCHQTAQKPYAPQRG